MMRYVVVWCDVIGYGVLYCDVVCCGTYMYMYDVMWYVGSGMLCCDMIWYYVIRCDAVSCGMKTLVRVTLE